MPSYPFECQKCGHTEDMVLAIDDRDTPQKCSECTHTMERQMCAPRFNTATGAQTHAYENNGRGRYYGQLARRMPFGKNDPQAYIKDPQKAKDLAKLKADSTPNLTYEDAS